METTLPDSFLEFWESPATLSQIATIRSKRPRNTPSHVGADIFTLAREIDAIPVRGDLPARRELAFGLVHLLVEFQDALVSQYGSAVVARVPVALSKHGFIWEAAKQLLTAVKAEDLAVASWLDARAVTGIRQEIRHPLTNCKLRKSDAYQAMIGVCVEVANILDHHSGLIASHDSGSTLKPSAHIKLVVSEVMTVMASRGQKSKVRVEGKPGKLLAILSTDSKRIWSHTELLDQMGGKPSSQKQASAALRGWVKLANIKLRQLLPNNKKLQLIHAENGGYRLSAAIRWEIIDALNWASSEEATGIDMNTLTGEEESRRPKRRPRRGFNIT